jgi:hypothetical protein
MSTITHPAVISLLGGTIVKRIRGAVSVRRSAGGDAVSIGLDFQPDSGGVGGCVIMTPETARQIGRLLVEASAASDAAPIDCAG